MQALTTAESINVVAALAAILPAAFLAIPCLTPLMRGGGQAVARRAVRLAAGGFILSLAVGAYVLVAEPVVLTLARWGAAGLTVYLDRLSMLILAMVAFLAVVITRYTVNHLAGDPGQARFVRRLCLTIAAVQCLAVAGNLLFFTLAWGATSWALHHLLTFFPDRPGAKLAARKKFLISRMGDLCLIGVLYLVWTGFGTWDFASLFGAIEAGAAVNPAIPFLLVAGALMKSAQLPFHSWLPETMEAPTPVSALMHAGIINAGGFLVLRLSPMVAQSAAALDLLIGIGGLTAVVASLVMITQSSIKRALAWSTISQMGFMMLQCGLGAFGLAALHIVAHSLYKAHAFLSTGGVVARAAKRGSVKLAPPARVWVGSLGVGALLTIGALGLSGHLTHIQPSQLVLFAVLALALGQLLAGAQVSVLPNARLAWGIALGAMVAVIIGGLHLAVGGFFQPIFGAIEAHHTAAGYALMALLPALLFAVILLQSQLARRTASPGLQRLYIHAYHGFYLGTFFARLLGVKGSPRPQ